MPKRITSRKRKLRGKGAELSQIAVQQRIRSKRAEEMRKDESASPDQAAVDAMVEQAKREKAKAAASIIKAGKRKLTQGRERAGADAAYRASPEPPVSSTAYPNDARRSYTQADANVETPAPAPAEQGRERYKNIHISREQRRTQQQRAIRDNRRAATGQPGAHGAPLHTDRAIRHVERQALKVKRESVLKTRRISAINAGSCSLKTAPHTLKTPETISKATVKSAEVAAKQMQKAHVVQRFANRARRAAQGAVKAVKVAAKIVSAAIRGIVAIAASGGGVALLVVVALLAFGTLLSSAFGVFFINEDPQNPPVAQIIGEIEAEVNQRIQELITTVQPDEVIIENEGETLAGNWIDVLAIFAVKTTTEDRGADVLTMDTERLERLRVIFWDMNQIRWHIEEREEPIDEEGNTVTIRTMYIYVEGDTADEQAAEYNFTRQQLELLEDLLSPDYRDLFYIMLGDGIGMLNPQQLENLYNNLPPGTIGAELVKTAFTRLGHPYSQKKAGQGNYMDCSWFARWVYRQYGIELLRTAAAQAEYCFQNGLLVSPDALQPGDLIFYSHNANGRFYNITHVAIYVGDGMIIDASSSRGQVVYRKNLGGVVMAGRPHAYAQ